MIIFRVEGSWNQQKNILQNSVVINGLETQTQNIRYLLIQRRDSLGFVEIMRGKYRLNEIEYIRQQLSGMTQKERDRLLLVPFEELWCSLWGVTTEQQGNAYRSEKENSRTKLESLRKGYRDEATGQDITLAALLEGIPCIWETPEWGFPKGRRDQRESEYHCALREVIEETGLKEQDIIPIKNLMPIQESFFGTNHIHYCHKYFIAYAPHSQDISLDVKNELMTREIGNIGWFSLENALKLIRPDNVEKREILLKASSLLRNYCPLCLSI
jgi:8-oxo-dGTP pyrophosphatase MutT (NUDIX family)